MPDKIVKPRSMNGESRVTLSELCQSRYILNKSVGKYRAVGPFKYYVNMLEGGGAKQDEGVGPYLFCLCKANERIRNTEKYHYSTRLEGRKERMFIHNFCLGDILVLYHKEKHPK